MSIKRQNKVFSYLHRWHPEVAIRYLPIVNRIKKYNKKLKILEIGSGSLGIAPYLKMPVTGLDVDFSGPKFPLLAQVRGKATEIPFENKSFDVVLSVDLLEHLSEDKREKAIQEMLRVARKEVIIAIPCGEKALSQDKKLDERYQKIFQKPFPYLKEHLKYGLPEEKQVLALIKKALTRTAKKAEIRVIGNENLKLRFFLMKGWMTKNFLIDVLFRKIMLFLIPMFQLINREPYYRQVFFVKFVKIEPYENRH